ncbi:polysaccharide deacetylase family protein [Halosolutus halophilus]|uniref:polysaccharide deacetylase family protein n=1 Tax=Halosolutus halophilus TaxID=1552990 RepID=UPI0022351F92|nr:polysaccharide deacetylase family protein [Halosolutus halophilus]
MRRVNARWKFVHRFADRHPVVLQYHSVNGTGWDDIPDAWFRAHLEWLQSEYEIVDLPDVISSTAGKEIALTFDDGLQSFHHTVLPILREYDAPATVYLIGEAVLDPDGEYMPVKSDYMTRDQLTEIVDDSLVTVGNHTRSHPKLSELDREAIEAEIVEGKEIIESELGVGVDRFCYPFNDYDATAVDVARRHHATAVTSGGDQQLITAETDPHRIPRTRGEKTPEVVRWLVPDFSTQLVGGYRRFFG